jgi:hypothetical protein
MCVVLCAAARLFLRKLKLTLKIPVLALVDSDPYGLKILSVYMKGVRAGQQHGPLVKTAAVLNVRCGNAYILAAAPLTSAREWCGVCPALQSAQ